MITNNSINFTSLFKRDKLPEIYVPEKETFASTAKRNKKGDFAAKAKVLLGIAGTTALMYMPSACESYNNFVNAKKYEGVQKEIKIRTKEDSLIIQNAREAAKEGRYDNILESQEFMQLLNYSSLDELPKTTREAIKIASKSTFLPINMDSPKSDDAVLEYVKGAQHAIDNASKSLKENPTKSYNERFIEYAIDNITDQEILDNVDMNELAYYQYDITLIKHMINCSRKRIKRNDPDAAKKREEEIKNAQIFVDEIVKSYKTREKVMGNYNGDETLSKGELATMLDMSGLGELPEIVKIGIISKALEGYKPISLRAVKDEDQIKIANQQVNESVDQAQKILDDWAQRARKEFGYLVKRSDSIANGDVEKKKNSL